MTAPEVFGRLLYTDCLPGTGRGAGGGFQVQAQSAGVDPAQSALAVGSLLYEVQVPWLSERRPVGDFPLGFAHAHGAGYGTAQGQYAGKAAAGGRDGNHVTDCLLAADGDVYGAIRPAQLWRSDLWRSEPWPDRECPPLPAAELEAGPLTVDAVADWARARPERGPALARLLTVLESPGGRRVVIVSDGPDEAMTWIAAATLLLPARQALEVSFKVFSSIPLRAEHRIAAAPASLFPQLVPGRDQGPMVLDAVRCACDEVPVSERAAFFTDKLLAGGDAYDVVDAVEFAAALDGDRADGPRLGGRAAMHTAWALTRPDEPVADPAALYGWLSGASRGLLAEHGPAVAAMVLVAAPSATVLRWIDAAVSEGRLAIDPAAVRAQLLTAEVAEIRGGRGTARLETVLPPVRLNASAARDAESELSSALLLGTSNKQADLLLSLARRHGITPELAAPLHKRLGEFVSAWIDHPGGYHPDLWALRDVVLSAAHDELRGRLTAGGLASVAAAIRSLNRHFPDWADLSDPLDCHIQASLIAAGSRADRLRRLRWLLGRVRQYESEPGHEKAAAGMASMLQRALVSWHAVDGELAVVIMTELPPSAEPVPAIADHVAAQLDQMSERPTAELLDLLAGLHKQGKAPRSGKLAALLKADKLVRDFTARALDEKTATDQGYLTGTVAMLRQADPAVVRVRLDDVLAACLAARNPELGPRMLTQLKSPLPRQLVERWAGTLGKRDPVDDGVWCVRCLDYEDLPDGRREQLAAATREYAQALTAERRDAWHAEVARRVGPTKRDLWESVFTEAPHPRLGSRLKQPVNLWRKVDGGRP
jgi:GTPase-associated protein 1, N-terminal domain type 2/GTPase-associated protein 1, middle domain